MKSGSEQWDVDDELLTETGRGGLFTDGYLHGDPLISYLAESETPLFVFGSGKHGVTRDRDGDTRTFGPGKGFRSITAVTDRRVQFVVGGGGDGGDWAGSIHHADIDRVAVDEGLIRNQLTIEAGTTSWQVPLRDIDTDRLVAFLETVSWAWIRAEEHLDDARKHLVDAGQHQKSRSYDAAHASLSSARRALGEAEDTTGDLAADASKGIRERIETVRARYRETKRRVLASRATHLVDEAEVHWREGACEAAYETYLDARAKYETVLGIDGLDPQKAAAMRDRIERIDSTLQTLSSAPLERADETRERAVSASDPEAALGAWEAALDQYRVVLELDWGRDEQRFEGDVDRIRDRIAEAVDGVLDSRRTLATECRRRGDEALDAGDVTAAREAYSEGISHLEAAKALAREFEPATAADIEADLDDLADRISDATDSVSEGYDDFDNWVTLSPEDGGGTGDSTPEPEADELPAVERPADADRLTDVALPTLPEAAGPDDVVTEIEGLEPRALLAVVETVWDTDGWRTDLRSEGAFLLADREEPTTARILLDVAADPLGPAAVENCADRAREYAADRAVLATPSDPTEAGRRRADELDVALLDTGALAALLDREDLTHHLPDTRP